MKTQTSLSLLKKILIMFLIWRTALFLIAAAAIKVLPYTPTFAYPDLLNSYHLPRLLSAWANFDGVHYLTIADKGYAAANLIQVFFPGFPLLMRVVSLFTQNSILSGLIISNFSCIGVMFFGYKLAEKIYNTKAASQFLIIILLFPTSFYLGAVYGESLFLLLLLAGCWYMETKKNLISGVLMGLSSGVRLVGLMVLPSLVMKNLLEIRGKNWDCTSLLKNAAKRIVSKKRLILGLAIGLLGFAAYSFFLWTEFGDPLYFFTAQEQFGTSRQTSLVMLPQTFYRSLMIVLTVRPIDFKYYAYFQDLLLSTLFLLAMIFSAKKLSVFYLNFSVLAYLLPTLTGNFSSMPRYVLVVFPVMMWWADILAHKQKLQWLYCPISGLMLVLNVMLFVQGFWVA